MGRVDLLHYLIRKHYELYRKPVYGRKKIQKLLFLVEHLDPATRRVTKSTGLTGYKFYIWLYGPFSEEVYRDLEALVNRGDVVEEVIGADTRVRVDEAGVILPLYDDDEAPKVIYVYRPRTGILWWLRGGERIDIDARAREKAEWVLNEYGKYTPSELEDIVLKLLGLTQDKKLRYLGVSVDEYLEREGLA